jgi:hypothetical protein
MTKIDISTVDVLSVYVPIIIYGRCIKCLCAYNYLRQGSTLTLVDVLSVYIPMIIYDNDRHSYDRCQKCLCAYDHLRQ